jgi:hypothetical protein
MIACLERRRPDLLIVPVATHPTGVTLVAGVDADNRDLLTNYNDIMAELRLGEKEDPAPAVLARTAALRPAGRPLKALISTFASLSARRASPPNVRTAIQKWKSRYL